jgi:hypothetical protein
MALDLSHLLNRGPVDPWPAPRNSGTPARKKTLDRLLLQSAMGWPSTSKLTIIGDTFLHPTKGLRSRSPGRRVEVLPKNKVSPKRPRRFTPLETTVRGMTNWQRKLYGRAVRLLDGKKRLSAEQVLAMAVYCRNTPRRAPC